MVMIVTHEKGRALAELYVACVLARPREEILSLEAAAWREGADRDETAEFIASGERELAASLVVSDSRFPVRCSCGESFSEREWPRLAYVGVFPGESLELRNCFCGSTISLEVP